MVAYHPSIKTTFKGNIKYGKDFAELLEKELKGGLPSPFPPKKHDPNAIYLMGTPEYSFVCATFDIENKKYAAQVSAVTSISDDKGKIGSCYKMKLGERHNQEEIVDILSKHGIHISKNKLIRHIQMHEYGKIMDPELVSLEFYEKKDQKLLEEINTPKRCAYFTVIQEEDEDFQSVHGGQRIIPKRLTETRPFFCGDSGHPYEFSSVKKDDLKNYPLVEIW